MHWLHRGCLCLPRSSLPASIPPNAYGLHGLSLALWISCIDCIAGVFVFPARVFRHWYRRTPMVFSVLVWRFGFNALIALRGSSSYPLESYGIDTAELLWSYPSWHGVLDLMHWLHRGGLHLSRTILLALSVPRLVVCSRDVPACLIRRVSYARRVRGCPLPPFRMISAYSPSAAIFARLGTCGSLQVF